MAKECAQCGEKNPTPMQKTCGYECATAWLKSDAGIAAQERLKVAREKRAAKRERKRLKERKEGVLTKAEWLKKAQHEFNRFIRLRDYSEPCISCQRHHEGQYHAGHYRSVGASPETRFDEDNCHRQCAPCNNHLSGNLIPYRVNLLVKIGQERVDRIEGTHLQHHYTIPEIKEIIKVYRKKANELDKQLKARVSI